MNKYIREFHGTQSIENLVGEEEIRRCQEITRWGGILEPLIDKDAFNRIDTAIGEELAGSEAIGFIAGFKWASRLWQESTT